MPLAGDAGRGAGREIYPGFAAAEVLYHEDGSVKGVATGDMGVGRDGDRPTTRRAWNRTTLIAEGVRGSLSRELDGSSSCATGHRPQKVRHRHGKNCGKSTRPSISLAW